MARMRKVYLKAIAALTRNSFAPFAAAMCRRQPASPQQRGRSFVNVVHASSGSVKIALPLGSAAMRHHHVPHLLESVLFIGTQFSNLYAAVDTPASNRFRVQGLVFGVQCLGLRLQFLAASRVQGVFVLSKKGFGVLFRFQVSGLGFRSSDSLRVHCRF